MEKQTVNILIGILIFVIIGFLVIGNQVGVFSATGGAVTRTVSSSSVGAGGTFTVTYTASGTGKYGVSIIDTLSGGCTFYGNDTIYKEVILSDGVLTRTLDITAPSSNATCIFTGDYKFGTDAIVNMPTTTITISQNIPANVTNITNILPGGECVAHSECPSKTICNSNGECVSSNSAWVIRLLNISPSTTENTLNFYVVLFYLAIIGVIVFIFKMVSSYKK